MLTVLEVTFMSLTGNNHRSCEMGTWNLTEGLVVAGGDSTVLVSALNQL